MSGQYILQNVSLCEERRFGRTWRWVKGFSWTDSLISTSELPSFCVLQKFLKQAYCDECRTDGQFRVVWDLPVWPSSSWTLHTLTANLSAFTSQGSSSHSCSFFPSHLISVYVSLSLLLLLEQTYEKSWQLSQRSFHKQHKASDNWSGCVAAGLSEGLALWVSNCSGSLAELRALHKLSVMWCKSQMACLHVRVCTRRKKENGREMESMCEREKLWGEQRVKWYIAML